MGKKNDKHRKYKYIMKAPPVPALSWLKERESIVRRNWYLLQVHWRRKVKLTRP